MMSKREKLELILQMLLMFYQDRQFYLEELASELGSARMGFKMQRGWLKERKAALDALKVSQERFEFAMEVHKYIPW